MSLFAIDEPRIIDICGLKFHTFHIDDKPLFDDIYFSVGWESLVWENSFAYLYPFACSMKEKNSMLLWKMIGNHLGVFVYSKRSGKISLYMNMVSKNNDGDLSADMEKCARVLSKINGTKNTSSIGYFPDSKIDVIFDRDKIRKHGGKFWSEYDDFIFRCDDLIKLEGKKYKGRRHLVNKFKSEHPNHLVRYMTDDDFDSVMAVRELWISSRFQSKKEVWDYDIFPHTLMNRDALGTRVTVIEVDGVIQGFFIMAKLGHNCSLVINENTNLEFEGLTEYLWYESLRMNSDLGEYENDGNGGKKNDGLYRYKMSHRPVAVIPKHGFILNASGSCVSKAVFKK